MKSLSNGVAVFLVALASLTVGDSQGEWAQYRGKLSNNSTDEVVESKKWNEGGLEELWRSKTPDGFSSFVVSQGRAFTIVGEEIDGNPMEVCVALDATDGKELWRVPLWLQRYDGDGGNDGSPENRGGDGPRSTPTVDADRVYVLDAHLRLYCLEVETGKEVWMRDIVRELGGRPIKWNNAQSPLLVGDLIFCMGGGEGRALLAFHKDEGTLAWGVEDDAMTHATPIYTTIHGIEQVVFFTQVGLVSCRPGDGQVLWRYPFPFRVSSAASPVVFEDIVYCSAGYGVGAGAARILKEGDGFRAEQIWRTENDNINHWSMPVQVDGYLYGLYSFKEYGRGPLACVDIRTGEKKWEEPGFGAGNLILAGDRLVVLSDEGDLVLVEPDPSRYRELDRITAVTGKCWSTPVLSGEVLYVRSTREGVALRVVR